MIGAVGDGRSNSLSTCWTVTSCATCSMGSGCAPATRTTSSYIRSSHSETPRDRVEREGQGKGGGVVAGHQEGDDVVDEKLASAMAWPNSGSEKRYRQPGEEIVTGSGSPPHLARRTSAAELAGSSVGAKHITASSSLPAAATSGEGRGACRSPAK